MEQNVIQMQEIFRFVRTGVGDEGQVKGEFRATGIRPLFLADLQTKGINFASHYFDPEQVSA